MAINFRNSGIWILRFFAAAILLQTLYFKFRGADESVYIFTTLGMEPWGRIATGVLELIASVLLLIPRTTVYGAFLGLGLMCGAIFFHLAKLGIVIMGDGGLLFIYACIVFVSCLLLFIIYKKDFRIFLKK